MAVSRRWRFRGSDTLPALGTITDLAAALDGDDVGLTWTPAEGAESHTVQRRTVGVVEPTPDYTTTFSDGTVGQAPPGTSPAYDSTAGQWLVTSTTTPIGLKALTITTPLSTGRMAVQFTGPGSSSAGQRVNAVALVRVANRYPALSAAALTGVLARGGGTSTTEDGYIAALKTSSGSPFIASRKWVAGAGTNLGEAASAWDDGAWEWVEVEVDAGVVRSRNWTYGEARPTTWPVAAADASLTAGWCGLFAQSPNSSSPVTVDIAGFAVKYGSGRVPLPGA